MKIHLIDIAEALERKIISNRMAPGVQLPSAAELAKQYSVSAKTADRALNRLVRRKLIVRKRGSGNFVCDNRPPESRLRVGVLLWALHEGANEELQFNPAEIFFHTLKELLDERLINYSIFMEDCKQLDQPVNREKKYDIFLMPAGVILNNKAVFRSAGRIPMVIYGDCKYNSGPWHQVIYDFHPGFMEALKYCRRQKISRFFLPVKDQEVVQEKIAALLECGEEIGYKKENFHFCTIPPEIGDNVAGGEYCAEYFLKNHLQDHLIFSVSDYFTYGMQKFFRHAGLKQAVDYQIISYDNFYKYMDEKNELFKVSAITHPLKEHARAVVDMIGELDRHPKVDCYRAYVTAAKEFVTR